MPSSPHILIVEDMPEMADLVVRKLQYLKDEFPLARIEIVDRWKTALAIIKSDPAPNVSFVDLTLPDSTMTNTIRDLDDVADRTTVVVVTGAPEEDRDALAARGFEVVFKEPKNFEGDGILRACYRALTKKSRDFISDDLDRNRQLAERLALRYGTSETS